MGKITFEQAEEIRRRHEEGEALRALAKEFGCSPASASHIVHYQTHWPLDREMIGVFLRHEEIWTLRRMARRRGVSASMLLSGMVQNCLPTPSEDSLFAQFQDHLSEDTAETPPRASETPSSDSPGWAHWERERELEKAPPPPPKRRGARAR